MGLQAKKTICVKIIVRHIWAIIAMHSPYLSIFFGLFLLACGMLTACGTKGPLYIPEQRYPQAATSKPSSAPVVDRSTSDMQHTGQ